jgi:hypothetical protein
MMIERTAADNEFCRDEIGPTAVVVERDVNAVAVGAESLVEKVS